MADSDGGESDASGSTVDLHSPAPQQTPEKRLSDHIQLTDAAFSPSSSGALHHLLSHREQSDIDIDSPDQGGYTTLMTCIKHKRRDSALLLMRNGADVLIVNSQCWSAFHFAASTGDLKVLQGLVAAARRASPTALAEALVALPVEDAASASCLLPTARPAMTPRGRTPSCDCQRVGGGAPEWRCHGPGHRPAGRLSPAPFLLTATGGTHAHGQDACGASDGGSLQGLPRPAVCATRRSK